ncbi:MAG TPA: glycosyltransferase family 2 protein [Chloroflexota bacterium]|nr:glycosyltransferase family 2 protein [Chloroflexota bacterium]
MRLVVQIPCFNEEDHLPRVIAEIPRYIAGVDEVLVLVVDDGSRDRTAAAAREAGADAVARHARNRGLAAAFRTGLDAALRLGADVIVNTDGDGQYAGAEIPRLIAPILAGQADLVVGDRAPGSAAHFSLSKRRLQGLGSWVVRQLSNTEVPDAPSGFRAFSRDAALRLNIVTTYSYTLETLIQAGTQRLAVSSVPITARATGRRSRLARSMFDYVLRSLITMGRAYAMYQPVRVFVLTSLVILLPGLLGFLRFFWYYLQGESGGHVQSLIFSAVLLIIGFQVGVLGLVADLIAANRRLTEETLYRVRRLETTRPAIGATADDRDTLEGRSTTHV